MWNMYDPSTSIMSRWITIEIGDDKLPTIKNQRTKKPSEIGEITEELLKYRSKS